MEIKYNNITFRQLEETWKAKLHSGRILELWKEILVTLPPSLAKRLKNANYTLGDADKNIKKNLKAGQIPFVFEIPYEETSLQDEFNTYASKFIIIMNLIK